MLLSKNKFILFLFVFLFGCAANNQSSSIEQIKKAQLPFVNSSPNYLIYEDFNRETPNCIIVLPFEIENKDRVNIKNINIKEMLRHTTYAHLSPLQYRDIEISKVDYFYDLDNSIESLTSNLNCEYFMTGKIIRFNEMDLKIYSNISVEVKLALFKNKTILWHGNHRVDTHGGSIPLSPIGVAFGLADAARNLDSSQYARVSDELIRKLIATLPDNDKLQYAYSIEEESSQTLLSSNYIIEKKESVISDNENYSNKSLEKLISLSKDQISFEEKIKIFDEIAIRKPNDILLINDYNQFLFDNKKYKFAQERINIQITNNLYNKQTYFLKGRLHLTLNELELAEQSFIKAIAIDEKDALSMNALGYVYSLNNKIFKAEAAYKMAISIDSENIFSHLNLGVLKINQGNYQEALILLENAAILSINENDYKRYLIIISKIETLKIYQIEVASVLEKLEKLSTWGS